MVWLWDNAVTIGTLVMAAAAVIALIYAHLQIAENRSAERRANANELWRETLRLAFDNPKLSDPTLKLAQYDYAERTIDGSIELFQKYELYVDTILNASEEILKCRRPRNGTLRSAFSSSRTATICCRPIFGLATLNNMGPDFGGSCTRR